VKQQLAGVVQEGWIFVRLYRRHLCKTAKTESNNGLEMMAMRAHEVCSRTWKYMHSKIVILSSTYLPQWAKLQTACA
jgi:L-rhamnose mutarotase